MYNQSHTTIILNTNSNINRTIPLFQNYKKVNLYLDNDQTGITAAQLYEKSHPNTINQSLKVYPGYKDFNEFLVKTT